MEYKKILYITEKQRQDINDKLKIFATKAGLKEEYDIEEYAELYKKDTIFDDHFKATLSLRSNKLCCFLNYTLYNNEGKIVYSNASVDEIEYTDGVDNHGICFKYQNNIYRLIITPQTNEDEKEYKAYKKNKGE